MHLEQVKTKIEELQKRKSFLEGQLQTLENQKQEIIKDAAALNVTLDQLPFVIDNLDKEVEKELVVLQELFNDITGKINSLPK